MQSRSDDPADGFAAGPSVAVRTVGRRTEIVDKGDSSRPAAEGVSGGVVYTHLHRDSQPMIRFYSGDESHLSYDPCPCGRTYPRLPHGVYGRLDDMLIIRGANVYPSQVQRVLLEVPGTGVEFVIVLERRQRLDRALVRVEHDPTWSQDTPQLRADLADRVRRRLKLETNIHFDVEILAPGTLERAVSKARRVHDLREKGAGELSGYVAWTDPGSRAKLAEALERWFGPADTGAFAPLDHRAG